MSDSLLVERTGGVATLTLNRPAALNSLTIELKEALLDALGSAAGDSSVRAVLLTGAGRAFCAGQDLREHTSGGPDALDTVVEHFNPIVRGIAEMPKPVVAAVNGMAAGAGASLAFAADFRIGGPATTFLMAFANVGLSVDSGGSWTLPRLVGHARAVEMLLLAAPVRAAAASDYGLLTTLTDDDAGVLPAALALAARLADGPTVAYAQIKRCLAGAASSSLADALAAEAVAQKLAGATADHTNATAAFLAKQKPVFEGR